MKCLHLPVRACNKMLLLVAWVWLVLPSTAFSWGMLPRELWCQASPRGLLGRPHLVKAVLCHFIRARASSARMRNLYGMRAGPKTINKQLFFRGYRAYRPTRKLLLTANHRRFRFEMAQNLTMTYWQHVIFGDDSRSQLYSADGRLMVHCLPGECF